MIARLLAADGLVRSDGYVYASDIGVLALSAALALDGDGYQSLTALARRRFIVDRPSGLDNPVVVWRRRLGPVTSKAEASGTAETVQLAQALLVGAEIFDRQADAELAIRLLHGYLEHAGEVEGMWIVRNHYDLTTRSFATQSYLTDYAPDLLDFVATQRDSDKLRLAATRSLALVRKARRPNGLIDLMVQVERRRSLPFTIFSPNDVIELHQVSLVAEQLVTTAPDIVQGVLRFARDRLDGLYAAYEGRSGQPHGPARADAVTIAGLTRLAVKVRDGVLIEKLRPALVQHAWLLTRKDGDLDLQVIAQALTGLQFLETWDASRPLPRALSPSNGRS